MAWMPNPDTEHGVYVWNAWLFYGLGALITPNRAAGFVDRYT